MEALTPEGFRLVLDAVSEAQERAIVALAETLELRPFVLRGQASKRDTFSFGVDYGGYRLHPGPPIPPELEPLRGRAAALAALPPDELVQALVTRYPPGAGIGWHRDFPAFGEVVVGVSLVGACRMRFRRDDATAAVALPPRSIYVLAGPARREWEHSIPAVKSLRYSVTFRGVRGKMPPHA